MRSYKLLLLLAIASTAVFSALASRDVGAEEKSSKDIDDFSDKNDWINAEGFDEAFDDGDDDSNFGVSMEGNDDGEDDDSLNAFVEDNDDGDGGGDGMAEEAEEEEKEEEGNSDKVAKISDKGDGDDDEDVSKLLAQGKEGNVREQRRYRHCNCNNWKRAYYRERGYKNRYYGLYKRYGANYHKYYNAYMHANNRSSKYYRLYRHYAVYYKKYYNLYAAYLRHYRTCNGQRAKCNRSMVYMKRGYQNMIKSHRSLIHACKGKK